MPWQGKPFGWGKPVPYLSFLPESSEATVNYVRQLKDYILDGNTFETLTVQLSHLESPSAGLMCSMLMENLNQKGSFAVTIGEIPKPDPRKSNANFRLWKYRGKTAAPAVACPADSFRQACATLAKQPYDYHENWRKAGLIASSFDVRHIRDLLSVMVHPPESADRTDPWEWVPRVQLAAAQIVANIERAHGVQPHDSNLCQIIDGPIDWVIDAAVIALTQWTRFSDLNGRLVFEKLYYLLARIPDSSWPTYHAVLQNVLLLPGLPDNVRYETEVALEKCLAEMAG